MMRINRYIALSGIASRRKAEDYIKSGLVEINDEILTDLAFDVKESDIVKVNGIVISPKSKKYYIFNKPKNCICSHSDPHCSSTIYDFLPKNEGLFSIGRLDFDTEGLLPITNDGDFSEYLSHPRYEKEKEYLVFLNRKFDKDDIKTLENGVRYHGVKYKADRVISVNYIDILKLKDNLNDFNPTEKDNIIKISLHEGKKREIKEMLNYLNYKVIRLIRIRFENLNLGDLKSGEYRELSGEEIEKLWI